MTDRWFRPTRPVMFSAPEVSGLSVGAQADLGELVDVWRRCQPDNVMRTEYLLGRVRPDNLNIAVPEDLVDRLGVVTEWPAKAVQALADRCQWDSVVSDEGTAPPALTAALRANKFSQELAATVTSAMTHGVAFLVATPWRGSVSVSGRSAVWAAALWDRVERRVRAGVTIDDIDDAGAPTQLTLFEPFETVRVVRGMGGWFVAAVARTKVSRPMMVALPFGATLDHPFEADPRGAVDHAAGDADDSAGGDFAGAVHGAGHGGPRRGPGRDGCAEEVVP